jgi:cell division protein FtsB
MARRKYVLKFRAKLMIVLVFLGYFSVLWLHQHWDMMQQQQRMVSLQLQIEQAQTENAVLAGKIQAAGSDAFIEQAARERLGWVKEGEVIFIEEREP